MVKVTTSSKKKNWNDLTRYYWSATTPQQYESRSRSIKLDNHLTKKRRRLRSDQTALLGSSANGIQFGITEITFTLWMWYEIRSYTCLFMQERRVCVTKAQRFVSHKKHHCIVTNIVTKLCKDIWVEPLLQQLTGEALQNHTARGNEVRLDICSRGF